MKSIFYISIFFFFSLFLNAQVGGKDSPLKLIIVHVPDSLKIQLLKITYLNDSDLTFSNINGFFSLILMLLLLKK